MFFSSSIFRFGNQSEKVYLSTFSPALAFRLEQNHKQFQYRRAFEDSDLCLQRVCSANNASSPVKLTSMGFEWSIEPSDPGLCLTLDFQARSEIGLPRPASGSRHMPLNSSEAPATAAIKRRWRLRAPAASRRSISSSHATDGRVRPEVGKKTCSLREGVEQGINGVDAHGGGGDFV